jgi:hypothetical protein
MNSLRSLCVLLPALLALLALGTAHHLAVAQPAARDVVLATGKPSLTQAMVDRVAGLLGEVVGKPLDAAQRDRLRVVYTGYWRDRVVAEMQTLETLDQLAQLLPAATPAQRAETVLGLREQMIPALRSAAPTDADARWLLGLHDEAQRSRPPTAGTPAAAVDARPAPPSNATVAATPVVPAAAPGAPGLRFVAPPGWRAEAPAGGAVSFSRALDQNRGVVHEATIWLFAPQAAPQGPAAAFVAEWRSRLGGPNGFALGDAVAHYRQRLPGGPVAYYMGNTFTKGSDREQDYYYALYVIDLLDGRTQTVAVRVVIGREQYSMGQQNTADAMRQLVPAIAPLLDSLRYPDARVPGPLVAAREVQGNWRQSSSVFAGAYVHAATGQSAGMGAASSGNTLNLQADGRYAYYFASYFNNPVAGQGGTATNRYNGRWTLQQQLIQLAPDRPQGDDPSEMAVGSGVLNTPQGPRRMLITVGQARNGQYRPPPWFPLWDGYDGVMKWYVQEQ